MVFAGAFPNRPNSKPRVSLFSHEEAYPRLLKYLVDPCWIVSQFLSQAVTVVAKWLQHQRLHIAGLEDADVIAILSDT